MPVLTKPRFEMFAQQVAAGHNFTKAYILAGYAPKSAGTAAAKLAKHPTVAARIEEIRSQISTGLEKYAITVQSKRMERRDLRYRRLHQVIDERAADPTMQEVPGGATGMLVRRLKQIGGGEYAREVEEFEIDSALLGEVRKLETETAKELGQYQGDKQSGTDVNVRVAIAFPIIPADQAASMTQAVEIDQAAAQRRLLSRPSDGKQR